MFMNISRTVDAIPPSGIRAFFDLVIGMKDVISLGVGEPDFVTPWHVREQAVYAIEQGHTSYTSNKGLAELRKDLARYLKVRRGLEYDWDNEMLVTVGGSEALDLAVRALLNPGEKVLYHEPCFVAYAPLIRLAGGEPVAVMTTQNEGFKVTPEALEKSWRKGTRALLLNYPCNPTGTSYTRAELLAIAKFVRRKDLVLISDEIYDELTYDFDHVPVATLPGMKERVIYLNGFSKTFAMTGWRIGWAAGPARAIAAMTKIHQYTMMCAPIISQMAAREALNNGGQEVAAMKKEYARRRNFVVASLNELGLDCHVPQGAFYAFPSIKKLGMSSLDFSRDLLEKEKVALVPGTAFGSQCSDYVRISYASSYVNLREACARIKHYLEAYHGKKI